MTHDELVEKHSKILGKVFLEVGEGWYPLIDKLCNYLQFHTDHNKDPQVVAVQVKEKFGDLRFYVESATQEQHAVISFVEYLSGNTCDVCGKPGQHRPGAWLVTRCEEHTP